MVTVKITKFQFIFFYVPVGIFGRLSENYLSVLYNGTLHAKSYNVNFNCSHIRHKILRTLLQENLTSTPSFIIIIIIVIIIMV
jgi:hypothetical protein